MSAYTWDRKSLKRLEGSWSEPAAHYGTPECKTYCTIPKSKRDSAINTCLHHHHSPWSITRVENATEAEGSKPLMDNDRGEDPGCGRRRRRTQSEPFHEGVERENRTQNYPASGKRETPPRSGGNSNRGMGSRMRVRETGGKK